MCKSLPVGRALSCTGHLGRDSLKRGTLRCAASVGGDAVEGASSGGQRYIARSRGHAQAREATLADLAVRAADVGVLYFPAFTP